MDTIHIMVALADKKIFWKELENLNLEKTFYSICINSIPTRICCHHKKVFKQFYQLISSTKSKSNLQTNFLQHKQTILIANLFKYGNNCNKYSKMLDISSNLSSLGCLQVEV